MTEQQPDGRPDPITAVLDRIPVAAKVVVAVGGALIVGFLAWPEPPPAPEDTNPSAPVELAVPTSEPTPDEAEGEQPTEADDGHDHEDVDQEDLQPEGFTGPAGTVGEDENGNEFVVAPDGTEAYVLPDSFPTRKIITFPQDLLSYTPDMSWVDQWENVRPILTDRLWAEQQADFEAFGRRYEALQEDRAEQNKSATAAYMSSLSDFGPDDAGRWEVIIAYRTTAQWDGQAPYDIVDTMRTWWVETEDGWLIDEVEFIPRSTAPVIEEDDPNVTT